MVAGLALPDLIKVISDLFMIYLFGSTTLGQILAFGFLELLFVIFGIKLGITGDGMILVIGVIGVFGGIFMFSDIGLKAIVGIAMGIIIFIALARLIRK